jgi:hypothetical protein
MNLYIKIKIKNNKKLIGYRKNKINMHRMYKKKGCIVKKKKH